MMKTHDQWEFSLAKECVEAGIAQEETWRCQELKQGRVYLCDHWAWAWLVSGVIDGAVSLGIKFTTVFWVVWVRLMQVHEDEMPSLEPGQMGSIGSSYKDVLKLESRWRLWDNDPTW